MILSGVVVYLIKKKTETNKSKNKSENSDKNKIRK